ncbi:MAG: hypothetical protein GY793_11045 [Proteobacteria bacterium]|nr:hypothetical protein [Pseudomonadota bacterium]
MESVKNGFGFGNLPKEYQIAGFALIITMLHSYTYSAQLGLSLAFGIFFVSWIVGVELGKKRLNKIAMVISVLLIIGFIMMGALGIAIVKSLKTAHHNYHLVEMVFASGMLLLFANRLYAYSHSWFFLAIGALLPILAMTTFATTGEPKSIMVLSLMVSTVLVVLATLYARNSGGRFANAILLIAVNCVILLGFIFVSGVGHRAAVATCAVTWLSMLLFDFDKATQKRNHFNATYVVLFTLMPWALTYWMLTL